MTNKDLKALAALIASQIKPSKKAAVKAKADPVDRKTAYEAAVMKGFVKKLGKTADIQLRVNVLPYKLWLEQGRIVRKGEHGVRGLFHVSQTDVLVVPTEQAAQLSA
jgi:hypothetical protein